MMKRFGLSLVVCFAAMIWGTVAHAEPGAVFGGGSGRNSCGKFIASIGKNPPGKATTVHTRDGDFESENSGYLQWLMGFLTGVNSVLASFNAAHPNEEQPQVTGIDIAGMDLWMRNWCNQHPTKMVIDGAVTFMDEMRSNAAARQR